MKNPKRMFKDRVYEQLARIGKAVASPQRLERLRSLESGTTHGGEPGARRDIRRWQIPLDIYRSCGRPGSSRRRKKACLSATGLKDDAVVDFFRSLRVLAASRLAELDQITRQFFNDRDALEPVDRKALLARVRKGLVTVLDVRPRGRIRDWSHCWSRFHSLGRTERPSRGTPS